MVDNNVLAVTFALLSAITIAWGTVIRHRIALAAGEDTPTAILQAVRVPRWWLGVFAAVFGYFLQIVALSYGTLLIVQPVLVLSLMFTLPLSAHFDGRRISPSETAWAGLLTVAVAVLVILGKPSAERESLHLVTWLVCLLLGIVVMLGLYAWSRRVLPYIRAVILGSITGAIMGYLAVLSKLVVMIFVAEGSGGLLRSWELYGLLACAVIGTGVQQASFNAGPLKNSLPAMTVVEPLVAFLLGYLVLGEKFLVTGWQWSYVIVSIAAMAGATIVLSRKTVDVEEN